MVELKIHFLDVADGDCILIEFPKGRWGLVDIHTNHSNTNVIEYIKKQMGSEREIFRFILTHPHQDHLHGLKDLTDAGFKIVNFWHIDHEYEPEGGDQWDEYEPHWNKYAEFCRGEMKNFRAGESPNFLDEDCIEILSPNNALDQEASELEDKGSAIHRNNYVIKISHGGKSILLCGDADTACLNHLLENYPDKIKSDVLKAPHHGTEAHFSHDFLSKVAPQAIIIPVGDGRHGDISNEYSKKVKHTFNTKRHGNIVITIGTDKFEYYCDKNSNDFN